MTAIEEILQKAIQGEIESDRLYTRAVDLVQAEEVKETLRELAREELGHKATLGRMLASPDSVRRRYANYNKHPSWITNWATTR